MAKNPSAEIGAFQTARRIILGVLIVALFAILLFVQAMSPPETLAHELIEWSGIIMMVLGVTGRLWATLYIGGRKSAEIVSGGPYSVTRNPLYLFSSIAAAGVGAQTGSIVVTLCFAVLCAGAFHIVILREEQHLTDVLGKKYVEYLGKVPRFFPNWSLFHDGETGGFRSKDLLRTLLDGLVFFFAIPAFELVDLAQKWGWVPVLFRLP